MRRATARRDESSLVISIDPASLIPAGGRLDFEALPAAPVRPERLVDICRTLTIEIGAHLIHALGQSPVAVLLPRDGILGFEIRPRLSQQFGECSGETRVIFKVEVDRELDEAQIVETPLVKPAYSLLRR